MYSPWSINNVNICFSVWSFCALKLISHSSSKKRIGNRQWTFRICEYSLKIHRLQSDTLKILILLLAYWWDLKSLHFHTGSLLVQESSRSCCLKGQNRFPATYCSPVYLPRVTLAQMMKREECYKELALTYTCNSKARFHDFYKL